MTLKSPKTILFPGLEEINAKNTFNERNRISYPIYYFSYINAKWDLPFPL